MLLGLPRGFAGETEAHQQALDVYLLLTALSVGHAINMLPMSMRIGNGGYKGFDSAMAEFDKGIKSMVDAFKSIAEAFGTHSTTKIIGKEACLGFNEILENTTVNLVQCLDDQYVMDFVESYFHDLARACGGDMEKVKGELLLFDHARGHNFSYDGVHFTNTGDSTVRMEHIFKDHDNKLPCSHWVIVEYSGLFQLAPDLIIWEKSESSWFGFKTSDKVYTQQVPHKISPQDVEALMLLFDIVAYGRLAQDRGLNYTWPSLPNCSRKSEVSARGIVVQAATTWAWASTSWSPCSKPCGGGQTSRSVYCISSEGQVDPTGAHCDGASKPVSKEACNDIPCTGKYLITEMKSQIDNLLKSLPSSPPSGSLALLQNPSASGGHDVVSVPPEQVKTVQNSWMVANNWPVNVTNEFDAIIAATSEQYKAFSFVFSPTYAAWTVVVGGARNFNGTIDMSYVVAKGTGVPVQQRYGNEKVVQCPAQQLPNTACRAARDFLRIVVSAGCAHHRKRDPVPERALAPIASVASVSLL